MCDGARIAPGRGRAADSPAHCIEKTQVSRQHGGTAFEISTAMMKWVFRPAGCDVRRMSWHEAKHLLNKSGRAVQSRSKRRSPSAYACLASCFMLSTHGPQPMKRHARRPSVASSSVVSRRQNRPTPTPRSSVPSRSLRRRRAGIDLSLPDTVARGQATVQTSICTAFPARCTQNDKLKWTPVYSTCPIAGFSSLCYRPLPIAFTFDAIRLPPQ